MSFLNPYHVQTGKRHNRRWRHRQGKSRVTPTVPMSNFGGLTFTSLLIDDQIQQSKVNRNEIEKARVT